MKKNNQAKSYFSYKNDDVELVELAQFIRDTTDYRVEREWYVFFNKMTGEYVDYNEKVIQQVIKFDDTGEIETIIPYKIRNPDLILIDKKTGKLKLVIEIDGGVHDKHLFDTQERNNEYKFANVPLLVINKLEIETTIFDLVHKRIKERFG